MALLVLGGQTLVHAGLSGLAGHRGDVTVTGAVPSTGTGPWGEALVLAPSSDASGQRLGSLQDAFESTAAVAVPGSAAGGASLPLGWLDHQLAHLVEQGPWMVAAHLGGALAVALWLAVGERALWRMLDLAAARACVAGQARLSLRATALLLDSARSQPVDAPAPPRPLPEPPVLGSLRRRGPPLLALAA